jgi:nickel superoxide dismutase
MRLSRLALALPVVALPLALPAIGGNAPTLTPTPAAAPAPAIPLPHCQVPCGIYGDKMRIDMLMEDRETIAKAMTQLGTPEVQNNPNQMVRWIMTKDEHAQKIQDQVAQYWLAQRIKVPAAGSDAATMDKYHHQLELLHRLTVEAMKCKQTTDTAHTDAVRGLTLAFSETYFSAEDLEHIRSHHGAEEEGH